MKNFESPVLTCEISIRRGPLFFVKYNASTKKETSYSNFMLVLISSLRTGLSSLRNIINRVVSKRRSSREKINSILDKSDY